MNGNVCLTAGVDLPEKAQRGKYPTFDKTRSFLHMHP